MITEEQLQLFKTLWEQSCTAVDSAHQTWWLMMQNQKSLIDSIRGQGFPFQVASDQFDKYLEQHQKAHAAALGYREQMSQQYGEALKQFKAQR